MNADTPTRGGNAPEPPAVLARGDCPPETPARLARDDDIPEFRNSLARDDEVPGPRKEPARGDNPPEHEEALALQDDPPEPPEMLAEAAVEALAELFPEWRIWADCSGWHAARRGEFVQDYHDGAPAFYVHAPSASGLAGQLRWQQAAQVHAPFGCSRSGKTG
jgi:hypothetical protein